MLGNPKTALITVIMVICWQFAPFVFMVLNSFKQKFEMLVSGVFSPPGLKIRSITINRWHTAL